MKKITWMAGALLFILTSCKKNLPDVGGTSTEKVANEWWTMLTADGDDVYHLGHFKLLTYNTSENNGQVWVDDQKRAWGFKVKAQVDDSGLGFSTIAPNNNAYYNPASPASFPQTVTITGGKVLPGAGRSKTGNVTDSLYLQVEFSDDPGTTYVISGHARTRFAEDEY